MGRPVASHAGTRKKCGSLTSRSSRRRPSGSRAARVNSKRARDAARCPTPSRVRRRARRLARATSADAGSRRASVSRPALWPDPRRRRARVGTPAPRHHGVAVRAWGRLTHGVAGRARRRRATTRIVRGQKLARARSRASIRAPRRFERIACVGLARASVPTLGTARGALAARRRLKTDFNEPESRCDVCKKQRGCACVRVGDNHYRCIKKPDTMKKCENSHNRISDEFHTVWRCRGAESGSRRRPRPATHALRRFGREPSAETGGRGGAA